MARSIGYSAGNWGTNYYYHADGNGNITYLVDSSQALAASYRYNAYGNTLSSSGTQASANVYRFSSKEIHVNSGFYYYLYRFYDPSLQRWLNRDPLTEPGFETLHLVTQPLIIRKLRLGINDPQVEFFLALAMQSGSINVKGYLRDLHTSRGGNSVSALEFLNLLRSGQVKDPPNWQAELLEGANLYDFVGNNPPNGVDSLGLWTWGGVWDSIKNGLEALWEGIKTSWGEVGTFLDTPKCPAGMYQSYTNAPVKNHFLNDPDNGDVPPQVGYRWMRAYAIKHRTKFCLCHACFSELRRQPHGCLLPLELGPVYLGVFRGRCVPFHPYNTNRVSWPLFSQCDYD